ncbi:MAG: restriction endonuclease subunit S [Ideonella sp.]|nr:restriction endonuclease subunit S [Ideonella sp.]
MLSLGELTVNHDTKRKPVKEADRRTGPYPYYGASGVVDHVDGFLFDGEYLLIAEDGENLRTRNTPVAFRATGRFWVNNHAHIVEGNERARTRYLEYAILSADLAPYLTGAVMPKLTQGNLNKIQVPCPPLDEQDAVVDVLGRLDDRIDLLRQTNATLESIAQALFKSWFIDFDPVRAKAEGREPEGMDAATAALFPAEFEESALGLIPKGWKTGTFGDLAELAKGSVNPLTAPEEEFEHFSLPAFDAEQLPVFERGETIKSNKTRVPVGAVLHSKLNPHIPRVWLPSRIGAHAVCSTEFLPWVARRAASTELVYCALTGSAFEASVRALVTGTSNSHQRVKPDQVAALEMILAPVAVSDAFTRVVRPLLRRVGENRLTAKALAELRDSLLPRLVSGKLRLPEAQEQLEGAAA